MPRRYKRQKKVEPKILRPLRVRFDDGEPADEGDSHKDLLGKRTKLGGMPDWIEYDMTPKCSSCGSQMSFVAQLDSIDYGMEDYSGQEYMFGDVGMIYVFYCFQCLEAKTAVDCY